MQVERVLVVGAGIGGLAAAVAFARRGVKVDVVEIRPDTEVHGVGIIQPANALRAVRSLGLLDEVLAAGFQFAQNSFYDWQGELIAPYPSVLGTDVPSFNALGRPVLHEILSSAALRWGAKIAYGVTWSELDESESGVSVTLTDGSRADYDLVVGFDGIRSPLRGHLFSEKYDPVFTGSAVWRVTMPRPPELTDFKLFLGDQTKAGLVPLSEELMYLLLVSPEPGNPRHDPADFPRMLVERLAGYGGLIGELRDRISPSATVVYSPISEVWLPDPWYRGRVVLLGDAAHACAPHLAQGAAMAVEDAVALAEECEVPRPIEDSLAALMKRRFERVSLVQKVSGAIEAEETSLTADRLSSAVIQMRTEIPERLGKVESALNQPF